MRTLIVRTPIVFFSLLFGLLPATARADEGMWTLDNFPSAEVEKLYGFKPGQQWLERARLSSVRLAQGCSASFVSPRGLVQTNHHCAEECIEQLSSAGKDYIQAGFYAKEEKDEAKCPEFELNQLAAIGDVTARVRDAIAGKEGAAFTEAKRAIKARIAKECTGGDEGLRCDVVELYNGGVYNLYKYRRFQDVRLVFAPEQAIAFFGGDPDNFEFPRYDYDVSYLRAYENGKPLDTSANYFAYAKQDAKPGDLTFTAGNPGNTQRLDTVAELEYDRDVSIPRSLFQMSELRGQLTEFSTKGPEEQRIATGKLFGVENSLKARKGQFEALVDPALIAAKAKAEAELRAKVDADPALKAEAGGAWDAIREILKRWKPKSEHYAYTEGRAAFYTSNFSHALALVRYPVEKAKPDEKRLPEYTDANFPSLRQSILADEPFYPELEKLTLTFSLTKLREGTRPRRSVRAQGARQEIAGAVGERADRRLEARRRRRPQGAARRRAGGHRRVVRSHDRDGAPCRSRFPRGPQGLRGQFLGAHRGGPQRHLPRPLQDLRNVGLPGRHVYDAHFLRDGEGLLAGRQVH